jgi:hypothetical protein
LPYLKLFLADTDYSVQYTKIIVIIFIFLDTATVYRNEEAVGKILKKAIKENNLQRQDIFITSKLGKTHRVNPYK